MYEFFEGFFIEKIWEQKTPETPVNQEERINSQMRLTTIRHHTCNTLGKKELQTLKNAKKRRTIDRKEANEKTIQNKWDWMTDEEREEAEERAAIMQYHGGLTPERAEFLTLGQIYERRERALQERRREQTRADHQTSLTFPR